MRKWWRKTRQLVTVTPRSTSILSSSSSSVVVSRRGGGVCKSQRTGEEETGLRPELQQHEPPTARDVGTGGAIHTYGGEHSHVAAALVLHMDLGVHPAREKRANAGGGFAASTPHRPCTRVRTEAFSGNAAQSKPPSRLERSCWHDSGKPPGSPQSGTLALVGVPQSGGYHEIMAAVTWTRPPSHRVA
ncbi:hypothetical protein TcBrA4_0064920 [Trypanosoma cruzi]|nr:hypothetical protein TcBrA4_0064920 [Trypanosoma cruzi]